jgi:hypothetical protein
MVTAKPWYIKIGTYICRLFKRNNPYMMMVKGSFGHASRVQGCRTSLPEEVSADDEIAPAKDLHWGQTPLSQSAVSQAAERSVWHGLMVWISAVRERRSERQSSHSF